MRIFIDITSDQSGGNFVPATVQNLQASLLSNTIQVSWDEFIVSNGERDGEVNMYRIERKVNEGAWQLNREFEEEDWATGFFIYDIDIEEGNTYYYRIKAFTTKGKETDWSNEDSVTIEEETPATVPGIVSVHFDAESSFNYIKFNWPVPDDGGSAITGYAIRRDGIIIENNWPTNEYIDFDAPSGNLIYNFAAINSVGQGEWSANKNTSLRGFSLNTLAISSSRVDITITGPWQTMMSTPHSWDIQRSIDNSNWVTIATDQTGIYEDKGLTPDTLYFYRAVMKNEYGISPPSSWNSVRTQTESSGVFNAPEISAEIDIDNQDGIFTTWNPDPSNTVTADYYEFEKIEDDGSPTISGQFDAVGGTAKDTTVTAGKVYKYRFRGYHSAHGYTPWSDQVTINLIYLNREYDFTYTSELQNNWTGGAYVYVPEAYRNNPVEYFPAIVSAHGQNERSGFGTTAPDFEKLSGDSSFTQYLRGTSNEVPCIIICPQVIGNVSTFDPLLFDEAIEKVCSELITTLSPDKIIVSGWSSGGRGAWQYGESDPKGRLAGLIPFATRLGIPANNTARDAYFAKNIPTWIFHNNDDTTQEVTNHIVFFDYAKSKNADWIQASIFDASGHAIVIKVISGAGGDIVEGNGYTPFKAAGNALWDWISDAYYGNI